MRIFPFGLMIILSLWGGLSQGAPSPAPGAQMVGMEAVPASPGEMENCLRPGCTLPCCSANQCCSACGTAAALAAAGWPVIKPWEMPGPAEIYWPLSFVPDTPHPPPLA
jgi:hypothetical protein